MKRATSPFVLVPLGLYLIVGLLGIGFGIVGMMSKSFGWLSLEKVMVLGFVTSWMVMFVIWVYLMSRKLLVWVGILHDERDLRETSKGGSK